MVDGESGATAPGEMPAGLPGRLDTGPPVRMDGAMNTELVREGLTFTTTEWLRVNVDAPEVVAGIHARYAAAGAELHIRQWTVCSGESPCGVRSVRANDE